MRLMMKTLMASAVAIGLGGLVAPGAQAVPVVENILFATGQGNGTPGSSSGIVDSGLQVTNYSSLTNFDVNMYIPQLPAVQIPAGFVLSSAVIKVFGTTSGNATITAQGSQTIDLTQQIGGKGFLYTPTIGSTASALLQLPMTVAMTATGLTCSTPADCTGIPPATSITLASGHSITSQFAGLSTNTSKSILSAGDLALMVGNGALGTGGATDTTGTCLLTGNCGVSVIAGFSGSGTLQTSVTEILHGTVTYDFSPTCSLLQTCTPEPASMSLLGAGLVGLGAIVRRRRKAA